MPGLPLGIRLSSLGLGPREAIRTAARMGVAGVQLDAVDEFSPEQLSQTGRRDLQHLLRASGLALTALAAPEVGLADPGRIEGAMAELGQLFELARYLGPGIVTTTTGRIPDSPDVPLWAEMQAGLAEVGRLADHFGGVLALGAGTDRADSMRAFIEAHQSHWLGVNLQPAAFLAAGQDPVEATRLLGARAVHAQLRDASRAGPLSHAQEAPLGEGQIDWPGWLAVLEEVDYRGYLVVETALAHDPVGHLGAAIAFLGRF